MSNAEGSSDIEVISAGGNALLDPKDNSVEGQRLAARVASEFVAELIDAGEKVIVTHGNGPQVGFMKNRVALALSKVHNVPLDALVANSQGALGYMIEQEVYNALIRRGYTPENADRIRTVVCQVVVEGLGEKTKPIGPFMTEEEAQKMMAQFPGMEIKKRSDAKDPTRAWREHVYSPIPREVLGLRDIRRLLDARTAVIYGGGGGVPVVREPDGTLRGIEGVVDKDAASQKIASDPVIRARRLSIFTEAEGVIDPEKYPNGPVIRELTLSEAKDLWPKLPKGTMGPKLKACADFVESTGNSALIASLRQMRGAFLRSEAGTIVHLGKPMI
jgi:carbamate kinase